MCSVLLSPLLDSCSLRDPLKCESSTQERPGVNNNPHFVDEEGRGRKRPTYPGSRGCCWLSWAVRLSELPSQGSAESGTDQGIVLTLGTSLSPLRTGAVAAGRRNHSRGAAGVTNYIGPPSHISLNPHTRLRATSPFMHVRHQGSGQLKHTQPHSRQPSPSVGTSSFWSRGVNGAQLLFWLRCPDSLAWISVPPSFPRFRLFIIFGRAAACWGPRGWEPFEGRD